MDKDLFGLAAIFLAVGISFAALCWITQSTDRAAIAAGLEQRTDAHGKVLWVKP